MVCGIGVVIERCLADGGIVRSCGSQPLTDVHCHQHPPLFADVDVTHNNNNNNNTNGATITSAPQGC